MGGWSWGDNQQTCKLEFNFNFHLLMIHASIAIMTKIVSVGSLLLRLVVN